MVMISHWISFCDELACLKPIEEADACLEALENGLERT